MELPFKYANFSNNMGRGLSQKEIKKIISDEEGKMRKKLSETQREIVIGKDKPKCCRGELRQRRIHPFNVCCDECNEDMVYEDEIIFHKKSNVDKVVEKWANKLKAEPRIAMLNEYDEAILADKRVA